MKRFIAFLICLLFCNCAFSTNSFQEVPDKEHVKLVSFGYGYPFSFGNTALLKVSGVDYYFMRLYTSPTLGSKFLDIPLGDRETALKTYEYLINSYSNHGKLIIIPNTNIQAYCYYGYYIMKNSLPKEYHHNHRTGYYHIELMSLQQAQKFLKEYY